MRRRWASPLDAGCDFHDSACLVAALDAVITVDSSAAHLVGSVGVPVAVIKPAAPE